MKNRALWVFVTLAFIASPPTAALAGELPERLKTAVEDHDGEVSVVVKHLGTGETWEYRPHAPMPTASLIKFPVMVEAYRQAEAGSQDLDRLVTLRKEDQVPGSGILSRHFSPGLQLSLRDAVRLMIAYSDNTATNLVASRIGIREVSAQMTALGLKETKLNSLVFRRGTSVDSERSRRFGLGSTTAAETVELYELLHRRELVSEKASEAMLEHLLKCEDKTKLGRDLPSGVRLAHKGGAVSKTRTDGGLLIHGKTAIAICVLTTANKDTRWDEDNAAHRLIGEIARFAVNHFGLVEDGDPDMGSPLKVGSSGQLVEALQRTLNSKLTPSPELSVDGDFGPLTQAAVIRFQKENALRENGVVDRAFWDKLGPLQVRDQPERPPAVVNSEKLSLEPGDSLEGPPCVSAQAWSLADKSGKLISHVNGDAKRDIASTTKIMTAYLVLREAERTPSVLSELATYSKRADATPGSTAGLRAGERLSVEELLYGLMLPSGNDAAVALAEHFGERLGASLTDSKDPLDQFVAAMNKAAKDLSMKDTRFRNPHGLTEPDHAATANDLMKLAVAAWNTDRFPSYVQTRQRGVTAVGATGYRRNIEWRNTNRLLRREGYLGVKTGTTTAAGACLVSASERGGELRFLVLLGSSSSNGRYVDSRNLHRYSWRQWPVGRLLEPSSN